MKNLLLIALVLVLAACQKEETAFSPDFDIEIIEIPDPISMDTVINKDYRVVISSYDFPGLRLPKDEIAKADTLLYKSLEVYNAKQEELFLKHCIADDTTKRERYIMDLRYYARQYVPQLNKKGEKEVVFYGMCYIDWQWKEGVPQISDGGDCYFWVVVNLSKNTFGELHPHGLA